MASKITIEQLIEKLQQAEFRKMMKEKKLELSKELTDDEIKDVEAEVRLLNKEVADIQQDIDDLEEVEASVRNSKHWASDKPFIEQAIIDNHVGYIIPDNKIIYCKNFGIEQSNAEFKYIESTARKPVRFFERLCNRKLKGADEERIYDLLSTMKRTYLTTTTSFNKEKWNSSIVYNQADIIMKYWIQPDIANVETYNKDFDILLHCVAGGKRENIEHLEKWVAYKYCHPDRVANTPNIDIGGQPGGNGKGRFVKLCETIFTPVCVIEAAAKEICAGFNANWAQAVVIHYDEPEENELPNSKIKNATGGESQRIEKKGIDAYMADRNHSFIFTSNNENGVVRLSGTKSGEDRRYSVIITNIVMVDYVMETENVDFDTAKERVNNIAQLVKDNKEVAKWLAHIIMKHNVMDAVMLQPLHGIDYDNRFQDQKTILNRAFDVIYPIFQSEGFIATDLLLDLIHILTDNTKYKIVTVRRQFENYLKNKKQLPKLIEKIRIDYQWKGASVFDKAKDRTQHSIITCVESPSDKFNYDLVSNTKMIKGIGITSEVCSLAIN